MTDDGYVLISFGADPVWHLGVVPNSDLPESVEAECGLREGFVLVHNPVPDIDFYDPGLALLLAQRTGDVVCADCCELAHAGQVLADDEYLWAEFDHVQGSH